MDSLGWKNLNTVWGDLVMTYSHFKLTNESDILVALSGVSSQIKLALASSDKYLAGLWLSELPHMLLWKPEEEMSRAQAYWAPSWCWASSIGGVRTHTWWAREKSLIEFVDAEIALVSELDPFGPVTWGCLRLRGFLMVGRIEASPRFDSLGPDSRFTGKFQMTVSDHASVQIGPKHGPWRLVLDTAMNVDDEYTSFEIDHGIESLEDDQVLCLPVLSAPFERVQGLLLRPTGARYGQYTRIGTFESPILATSSQSSSLCFIYEDLDEHGIARFSII